MALVTAKLLPIVLSLFFAFYNRDQKQGFVTTDTTDQGVVSARSNTKCKGDLMDSKEAQEYIHDDETIVKITLQFVFYPLILLYQWILVPMSRSSYVSSLWTMEAFFIVFLPYFASFIAIVVCMFYIHVLGGEPFDVRPLNPEDTEDSLSDIFSSSWLTFRLPRTDEQKPQTSNAVILRRLQNRSEALKQCDYSSGETSENDKENVTGFRQPDSFSCILNENFNQRKKLKMNNKSLKCKDWKVVSIQRNNLLNGWRAWCRNTPQLVRRIYIRALCKRIQHMMFIHAVDVRLTAPLECLQVVTNKKYTTKIKVLRRSMNVENRDRLIDFYTFSLLSTLVLGPRALQPTTTNASTKKGRRQYDVILLISVLRRMIVENSTVKDHKRNVCNELGID